MLLKVQIVVYETHSRLELENGGMVKAVVEEMNGWAYEKHNLDNYSSISAEDKSNTSVETPWRPAVVQPVQVCVDLYFSFFLKMTIVLEDLNGEWIYKKYNYSKYINSLNMLYT